MCRLYAIHANEPWKAVPNGTVFSVDTDYLLRFRPLDAPSAYVAPGQAGEEAHP